VRVRSHKVLRARKALATTLFSSQSPMKKQWRSCLRGKGPYLPQRQGTEKVKGVFGDLEKVQIGVIFVYDGSHICVGLQL
jgi:hypothetical protein